MNNDVEIWKDIPDYEGLYQVSSFGRVKSLKFGKEKLISTRFNLYGYLVVDLCVSRNRKAFKVHQVVAMAFYGHKPDGYKIVVDHIDNNPLNNRADNLNLTTQRENTSKDKKGYSSEFVGVHWDKSRSKWAARIYFKGRNISLGYFELEIDAADAYDKAFSAWKRGLDLNILYPKRMTSSKYKWVYWYKRDSKWQAKYKGKHIGYFNAEIEAHEAVQNYIEQLNIKQNGNKID